MTCALHEYLIYASINLRPLLDTYHRQNIVENLGDLAHSPRTRGVVNMDIGSPCSGSSFDNRDSRVIVAYMEVG